MQTISPLSQFEAPILSSSKDPSHVDAIQRRLFADGVVKIHLNFLDNKSEYLEHLIRKLHSDHGHGLPIDHSASRGWFWDVRPTIGEIQSAATLSPPKISFQARSETMESFPWHTDCSYESSPPRYFALQVLQPDQCNGGVFSILPVVRILERLSSVSLDSLSRPEFRIDVPPEFAKGTNEKFIVGSLLSTAKSSQSLTASQLRFREDIIAPLTKNATAAVEELRGVLREPEVHAGTIHLSPEQLPAGSILLMDNRRWLHARRFVYQPSSLCSF